MHVQHVFKTCNFIDYQALFNRFVAQPVLTKLLLATERHLSNIKVIIPLNQKAPL